MEGFYTSPENKENFILKNIIKEDENWAFIILEENELDSLPTPENTLDTELLHISATGSAWFVAYGKHTNEEFWTEKFDISDLTGCGGFAETIC